VPTVEAQKAIAQAAEPRRITSWTAQVRTRTGSRRAEAQSSVLDTTAFTTTVSGRQYTIPYKVTGAHASLRVDSFQGNAVNARLEFVGGVGATESLIGSSTRQLTQGQGRGKVYFDYLSTPSWTGNIVYAKLIIESTNDFILTGSFSGALVACEPLGFIYP